MSFCEKNNRKGENMNDNLSDLHTDRLIGSFGASAAAGLSSPVGGSMSHDRITRMLSPEPGTSADLRRMVRPPIRQSETADGVPITDDGIPEKPPTDGNEIICRHHDRCGGRNAEGISFMTAPYHSRKAVPPVGFQIVAETEYHTEKGREKRRCPVPENRYCREMISQAVRNRIRSGCVPADVRSASAGNMMFGRHGMKRSSVMPVKADRSMAMSSSDRRQGRYVRADEVMCGTDTPIKIFPGQADFPLFFIRQVFADRDGSEGVPYPVTADTALTYEQITAIYRRRRNTECHHRSLRQNASPEKPPGKIVNTRTNHFSACLCGYVRPEMLRFSGRSDHFAPKAEISISALRSAFSELQKLQPLKIAA